MNQASMRLRTHISFSFAHVRHLSAIGILAASLGAGPVVADKPAKADVPATSRPPPARHKPIVADEAAKAEEPTTVDFPSVEGEISFDIQNDSAVHSDDEDAEITDLSATIEPSIAFLFSPAWSLHSDLVFESVRDPEPGEDHLFEDQGLYIEQLYLQYEGDWGRVYAGKFNPPFGIAWDRTPGIYGTDFAEDYELTERVGAGVELALGEGGHHKLSLNAFAADRSILSESIFTDRGRVRKSDGGASNTDGPQSFTITLDGAEFANLPGFAYHAGLVYQKGGAGDPGDETGLVFGVTQTLEFEAGRSLELLAEAAFFNEFDATEDDARYLTLGAAYQFGGHWNVAAAGALRSTDVNEGDDVDDWLFQMSAGYKFDSGIGLDAGYRLAEEEDARSDTLGVLAAYTLEF